jgi:hypothetical protein
LRLNFSVIAVCIISHVVCMGVELGITQIETKRRGRVVNTPVSYSGGFGFKSQCGDQLF